MTGARHVQWKPRLTTLNILYSNYRFFCRKTTCKLETYILWSWNKQVIKRDRSQQQFVGHNIGLFDIPRGSSHRRRCCQTKTFPGLAVN